MSDFINEQQSDELVSGNFYMGEYQPTEQDLADMNAVWGLNDLDFDLDDCQENDAPHEPFYDLFEDGDALASAGMGMDEDYSMGDFYDSIWDDGGMNGSDW